MAASAKDPHGQEQHPDFLVSYTGADVAWAEWIAWQLEAAGHVVLIQAWDFGAGSDFVTEMRRATAAADRTLAVLSPAYVASGFAIAEWNAAFAADPTGEARKLLPVRVVDFSPSGLDATRVYVDLVGLGETAARARLLAAVRTARAKPKTPPPFPRSPTAPAPFPGRLPDIWNAPARNPNFAGRHDELDKLRTALGAAASSVAVLAVSGLGGVGKTQLAIEHAWRRASDYDLVWWVPAEVPATVAGALTALANALGVPTENPKAVVELLHAELARRTRWLVVFDNAEDPGSIGPYLPAGGDGHVLVTSRNPAWRARGAALEVSVWPRGEAVAFLLARTGSDDEAAAASVADELGLLPLALEQAGSYVEETGMTLGAYRDLLTSRRGRVLERGTPTFYRTTVAATFGLAYDRAAEVNPAAAVVLGTCAFFAPDDIPTELVASADPLVDEDALATLRRLALTRRQGDSLSVHRLIGDIVRNGLRAAEVTTRAAAAVAALARAFPNPAEDHRSWPRSARLLPHVLAAADHAPPTAELATLLTSAGIYLRWRVQLRSAKEVLQRALRIFDAVYGADHPDLARTLRNLANVLADLGDREGARAHEERALRIYEAAYGPDHPEVARTLNNLAVDLRDLGDLAGAREHQERALRIKKAAYGPDHPEVGVTLGNLGLVLRDLGDLGGARSHQERALRIYEAAYGPDHPDVARTLNNLGVVLRDRGDLGGARDHHERALRIYEAAYGPDHPDVARTLNNLGVVLRDRGDLGGARDHHERALRIYEAAYGRDHPDVAATLGNLGLVLRDLGDLGGARSHQERALRIKEAAYGRDHLEVARTLRNLGLVLLDLGDLRGAREQQERALRIYETAYGPDHPEVACTRNNLGLVLRAFGDSGSAG